MVPVHMMLWKLKVLILLLIIITGFVKIEPRSLLMTCNVHVQKFGWRQRLDSLRDNWKHFLSFKRGEKYTRPFFLYQYIFCRSPVIEYACEKTHTRVFNFCTCPLDQIDVQGYQATPYIASPIYYTTVIIQLLKIFLYNMKIFHS